MTSEFYVSNLTFLSKHNFVHVPSLYSSFFFTIGEIRMASQVFSITNYFSMIKDSNQQFVLQGFAFAFLCLNWLYPLYFYFLSCVIFKCISHL